MLYVLVLAALAKAAVLPKAMSEVALPIDPLSERSADIHDWAMVCAYDKAATSFCQRHFGYGCDASGKLKTNIFDHDCSVLCNCINLYPTKNCLIGLTGQTYCLRSEAENETSSQMTDEGRNPSFTLSARSNTPPPTGASQLAIVPSVAPSENSLSGQITHSSQEMVTFAEFHNRATICTLQHFISADCFTTDQLRALASDVSITDTEIQDSVSISGCLDLFSKIQCSFETDGMMLCDGDATVEEMVYPEILNTAGAAWQLKLRGSPKQHHNYAMTCDDSQTETEYCKNDGYYCDSAGKLSIGADGTSNKFCRNNCNCVNIGARRYLMSDYDGAVYVLSSETIQELYFLDHSCVRNNEGRNEVHSDEALPIPTPSQVAGVATAATLVSVTVAPHSSVKSYVVSSLSK